MIVRVFPEIDDDLDEAFSFYESRQAGLGLELIEEYRRAIDRIIQHPAKGRA